jgi:hypothetical protein
MPMPVRSTSAGSTPTHGPQDSLSGVGGDVQEAFAQGESPGEPGELRDGKCIPAPGQGFPAAFLLCSWLWMIR